MKDKREDMDWREVQWVAKGDDKKKTDEVYLIACQESQTGTTIGRTCIIF